MYLYLLILLRIIDRDYERFIRVDVYSSVSEFIMEISLDNPECISPILLNPLDLQHQHLEKLLVDLARSAMAG